MVHKDEGIQSEYSVVGHTPHRFMRSVRSRESRRWTEETSGGITSRVRIGLSSKDQEV